MVEILEEHDAYPSALPARRDQRALGLGHHPGRVRQLVHLLHRADRPRSRDQPAHGRHRARGRGARRRRRARDHRARPERQLLRARPRRRAVPPAVRRPAACARRGRRHRPHPLHVAAPEGPPARDHRGDGRVRRRCASTCTSRCSRGATARSPACTAATPPSATCAGWPTRAPPSPTSRSPPTSSSASPARPTTTSSARSRWSTPPPTTPPTRSCSRPARAPRRPTWSTTSSPPRSRRSACAASPSVVERSRAGQARGPRRAHGVAAARGAVEERRHHVVGPHPPEQARALRSRGSIAPVVGGTADVVVTYAAPHWLRGDLLALTPPPRPARIRIPVVAAPA